MQRPENTQQPISKPDVPKLLFLAERFSPELGGVGRSATRVAEAISQLGVDVHVLAWTKRLQPGQLVTVVDANSSPRLDGATVHRLGLFANWDYSLQHTFNILEWLHEQHGYHAVWGHYVYPAGFAAVMFAESNGLPSTVSARGNDIDRLMFPPGDFARLTWTLERANVVSTVSEDLAKKIDVLLGKGRDSILLPNVVDTEVFRPAADTAVRQMRNRLGYQDGEIVLGFCGELRHKKGLPFLLKALCDVNARRPGRLLVIGDVRPRERRQLSTFVAEHPELADRLTVTGHHDSRAEVAAYMQVCDVVLHPSLWDGVPNAILEAMACGKIVIASDAGGIPEVISHGTNGVIVQRQQLHRLGEAIIEVIELPAQQAQKLRTAAREFCKTQLRSNVEAEALRSVLQRLNPDWSYSISER